MDVNIGRRNPFKTSQSDCSYTSRLSFCLCCSTESVLLSVPVSELSLDSVSLADNPKNTFVDLSDWPIVTPAEKNSRIRIKSETLLLQSYFVLQ